SGGSYKRAQINPWRGSRMEKNRTFSLARPHRNSQESAGPLMLICEIDTPEPSSVHCRLFSSGARSRRPLWLRCQKYGKTTGFLVGLRLKKFNELGGVFHDGAPGGVVMPV